MPVNFKKPPVNEVVIATRFNPVLELRSEHIGLFWSQIRNEFPVVKQQPPVDMVRSSNEIFPMPRFWFTAKDEAVIQVQKNAIVFNWRRLDDGTTYPRYRFIKPKFDHYFTVFQDFVRKEVSPDEITIDLCELTYVNMIQKCQFWTGPQDTNKILPSFSSLSTGIDDYDLSDVNCSFFFRATGDLRLQVRVRSGMSVTNPNVPILVFEIKATEQVGNITKSEADEWIDRAHVAVMNCFLGMTSQGIQTEYWKRGIDPYD